jgi:uncharacterized membrane protein
MYSKAKIAGHPIHPMIVAFPIAFYTVSLIAFLVYQYGGMETFWFRLAYFCTFAGVGTAVLAAIPGFIDWAFGIPSESAGKKRGLIHMGLNVAALLLFAANAYNLYGKCDVNLSDVTGYWVIALVGVLLTLAAGYHGWELIATHKVGVNLTPEQERLEPVEKMSPREQRTSPMHPQTV